SIARPVGFRSGSASGRVRGLPLLGAVLVIEDLLALEPIVAVVGDSAAPLGSSPAVRIRFTLGSDVADTRIGCRGLAALQGPCFVQLDVQRHRLGFGGDDVDDAVGSLS